MYKSKQEHSESVDLRQGKSGQNPDQDDFQNLMETSRPKSHL